MNCEEFSEYLIYCLAEFETDLPPEACTHLLDCPKCQARCEELKSAFTTLHRQMAEESTGQEAELLARVQARVQERLKMGDLPDEPDIDCPMVRPLLTLAADPLELIVPPAWMEEHLAICENCRGQLEHLEGLCHTITVAEMPVMAGDVVADAPDAFLKKVYKLRAIRPEDITCDQAEPHYLDLAGCNLEVPAELYRHVKNCASCKEQVQQLRRRLGITIPQVGSPEFEELLSGKGIPQPELVGEVAQPGKPSRVGAFLQRNWRKLTVGAAAAALIIGFLIIGPGRAFGVTFEQVCEAFARAPFICIIGPRETTWYAKDPLVQFRVRNDGTYTRFSSTAAESVRYKPNGELWGRKQYAEEELKERIKALQRDLDFRRNLGLPIDVKVSWTIIQQDVTLDERLVDVYELTRDIGKLEDEELEKFKIYVDKSTDRPVQRELYKRDLETKDWSLIRTVRFVYPEQIPEEILSPKFTAAD